MTDEAHGPIKIHKSAHVEPTAVIIGPATIKAGAYVGHYAVVGSPAQHHGYYPDTLVDGKRDYQGVVVYENAIVREHSQVQQGIKRPTEVGFDAMVMAGSHISHDTIIGPDVTVGTNSIFGGFTIVMYGATLGQKVVTHPWVTIGQHSMIGQGSCVIRNVAPWEKVAGNPARTLGFNSGPGGEKKAWDIDLVDEEELSLYRDVEYQQDELRRA